MLHLCGLPHTSASALFPSDYPTKIWYAFLNSPMLCLLIPFVLFTFNSIVLLFGQDCLYFSPTCSHLRDLGSYFVAVFRSQTFHCVALGAFATLQKATVSLVKYVRPHGRPRPQLDGFSWYLTFMDYSEICGDNSRLVKIWQ